MRRYHVFALFLPLTAILGSAAFRTASPVESGIEAYGSPVSLRVAGNPDSLAAARDSAMQEVLRAIAGRERMPAESVFTNIQSLRGIPAGRLPRIMNLGYGRSLGVGCDHCHTPGEWASDSKPQKQIARQMSAMVDTINRRLLPGIANLQSAQPVVNCTTCHRGAVKPATDLPPR